VQATQATFCLTVGKQLADLASPPNITPGFNWPITITDPTGGSNGYFTNTTDGTLFVCGLTAGAYTVTEGTNPGIQVFGPTQVIGLTVNGVSQTPQTVYSFTWAAGQTAPVIVFKNQPLPIG
jgi:hypothetical protein